ncbi:hypothetical protein NPIL_227081 [Nephila pilipes]|uniref:Uncharacterized protein n=1 Tax=Nephila pilipes TaxID=299642 RepID=A0A8X6N364_NEPPI|nr:hypothetical protein NPIL_227081 [Nephila pilipes]
MTEVNPVCEFIVSECCKTDPIQEKEPMDWEDVPTLLKVIPPSYLNRPPRKMRCLIPKVSEPPVSANRFPNMRALVPKITLWMKGGVFFTPPGVAGRQPLRDQSSRPPSGVPRATLCFELMTAADWLRKESNY